MSRKRQERVSQLRGRERLLGPHGLRTVALIAVVTGLVAGGAAAVSNPQS